MLLEGHRCLVFGITNKNSIGWSIARAWRRHGADVGIAFQQERFRSKIEELVKSDDSWNLDKTLLVSCDLTDDSQIESCKESFCHFYNAESVDTIMHSVAFAPKECLHQRFVQIPRESFRNTMEASVYSLIAICEKFHPLLAAGQGGNVQCMTFDGVNRVVHGYGLMGPAKAALEATCRYLAADLGPEKIRVNAISAGPVNTLSARGLPRFHEMKSKAAQESPLRREIFSDDIGDLSVFLASNMAKSITGQTVYVDAGHSIVK